MSPDDAGHHARVWRRRPNVRPQRRADSEEKSGEKTGISQGENHQTWGKNVADPAINNMHSWTTRRWNNSIKNFSDKFMREARKPNYIIFCKIWDSEILRRKYFVLVVFVVIFPVYFNCIALLDHIHREPLPHWHEQSGVIREATYESHLISSKQDTDIEQWRSSELMSGDWCSHLGGGEEYPSPYRTFSIA